MDERPGVRQMHESNRAAWNEGAAGYDDLIGDMALLPRGGSTLKPVEVERLGDLRTWCRRAIHLQCASGADTLSLVNLGVSEVVGVDISDVHIENARRKTERLGFPARWYRCDVLDAPIELDGWGDLVYTGKGAINWLQELDGWARTVARLLRPGGRFFLYESHPIVWLFKEDAARYEREERYRYFDPLPETSQGWPDWYIGNLGRPADELAVKYERLWPVSVVITSLVQAGLQLERFDEYPTGPFSTSLLPNIPEQERAALPQSYSLLMTRPAASG